MKQFFIINNPIYRTYAIISINQTDDELIKDLRRCKIISNKKADPKITAILKPFIENRADRLAADALTVLYTNGVVCIRFYEYDCANANRNASTVAHEMFHAVEMMLMERGLEHSEEASEAWAYLLGYLIEEFYNNLKCS